MRSKLNAWLQETVSHSASKSSPLDCFNTLLRGHLFVQPHYRAFITATKISVGVEHFNHQCFMGATRLIRSLSIIPAHSHLQYTGLNHSLLCRPSVRPCLPRSGIAIGRLLHLPLPSKFTITHLKYYSCGWLEISAYTVDYQRTSLSFIYFGILGYVYFYDTLIPST